MNTNAEKKQLFSLSFLQAGSSFTEEEEKSLGLRRVTSSGAAQQSHAAGLDARWVPSHPQVRLRRGSRAKGATGICVSLSKEAGGGDALPTASSPDLHFGGGSAFPPPPCRPGGRIPNSSVSLHAATFRGV